MQRLLSVIGPLNVYVCIHARYTFSVHSLSPTGMFFFVMVVITVAVMLQAVRLLSNLYIKRSVVRRSLKAFKWLCRVFVCVVI